MNDVLRIAHLRIAHQGAILRWAILTFTGVAVQELQGEDPGDGGGAWAAKQPSPDNGPGECSAIFYVFSHKNTLARRCLISTNILLS